MPFVASRIGIPSKHPFSETELSLFAIQPNRLRQHVPRTSEPNNRREYLAGPHLRLGRYRRCPAQGMRVPPGPPGRGTSDRVLELRVKVTRRGNTGDNRNCFGLSPVAEASDPKTTRTAGETPCCDWRSY